MGACRCLRHTAHLIEAHSRPRQCGRERSRLRGGKWRDHCDRALHSRQASPPPRNQHNCPAQKSRACTRAGPRAPQATRSDCSTLASARLSSRWVAGLSIAGEIARSATRARRGRSCQLVSGIRYSFPIGRLSPLRLSHASIHVARHRVQFRSRTRNSRTAVHPLRPGAAQRCPEFARASRDRRTSDRRNCFIQ